MDENANFALMKKNIPKANKQICKVCGASKNTFIINDAQGDVICPNCGAIQNIIFEHQSPTQGNRNGKQLFARIFTEENQKIRLLTTNFFNVIFSGLRDEFQSGKEVASMYQNFKKYRATHITKGNISNSLKGLHMPTVVICILYCKLLNENRGIPLSMMVVIMNQTIIKSRSDITPVVLKHANKYRTEKKYGLAAYLKTLKMKCYSEEISPRSFIIFPCNTLLNIRNKNEQKVIVNLANEIYKEYPQMHSSAFIACGVLYYVYNKKHPLSIIVFGLTKKELTDNSYKIENSLNPKIVQILLQIK